MSSAGGPPGESAELAPARSAGLAPALRYVALGDSFTAGVGASSPRKAWPSLLARRLATATGRLVSLVNPSGPGFTTDDLIRHELPVLETGPCDFITVCIGGNDILAGRSRAQYEGALQWIYDAVAARAVPAGRAVVISIPDWSASPAAAHGRVDQLRMAIEGFNAIARTQASARGFTWADVTGLSRSRIDEPGWMTADGIHPGDEQYAAWAVAIWEACRGAWPKSDPPAADEVHSPA